MFESDVAPNSTPVILCVKSLPPTPQKVKLQDRLFLLVSRTISKFPWDEERTSLTPSDYLPLVAT